MAVIPRGIPTARPTIFPALEPFGAELAGLGAVVEEEAEEVKGILCAVALVAVLPLLVVTVEPAPVEDAAATVPRYPDASRTP